MFEDGRDAGIECMVFHFLFLLAPNLYPCMNLTSARILLKRGM